MSEDRKYELEFRITGIVFEQETGQPLPNLIIRAYDKDLLYDDLLGDTTTDESGRFEIRYTESDFKELFEKRPDIYFRIYDASREHVIHATADSVRWNAGKDEFFEIGIPRHKLPPDMFSEQNLLDGQGNIRDDFEVGESLLANLQNLEPSQSYMVRLLDDDSEEIFNVSLVSNRYGVIEPTVLWPDMGIGIPEEGGRYAFETLEEAVEALAGRTFTLEVLTNRAEVVQTIDFSFTEKLTRTRLYPISKSGALRRGLLLGEDAVRFRGQNFPPGSFVDLYLVERQYDWHVGDAIVPVHNLDGSEVAMRIQLEESDFEEMLWPGDLVQPGSYDVIARVVREYEYRAEGRLLRATDFVSERLMTTLVVHQDLYAIKPIFLGCVNLQEIAGRNISGSPYFEFTNVFAKGEDIYAAIDPTGLLPGWVGKKVRFLVVKNGTITPGATLTDETGTVSEVITSSGCVNANKTLVWSNPQKTGKFDLVADFGNLVANPGSFIADNKYDIPDDMVDGYTRVGFYILDDPSVTGTTYKIGQSSYSGTTVTIPANGVWCSWGDGVLGDEPVNLATGKREFSLPLTARIRYPAVTNGTNVAVHPNKTNYPLVVVMHGMSGVSASYEGYDYLLDHLASHGFIAVSIDCYPINNQVSDGGMQDTRAYAMLEHLAYLKNLNNQAGVFQGKIDMTKIGIMGHSRGGDGVVQAEIYNQSLSLGYNIKAIVALAPTDFSGTNPTTSERLKLTTSKFLCIYGSNDGDVWGGVNPSTAYTGTGFRFYDRATVEKAMVFIYRACHNRFNTKWGTDWKLDVNSPALLGSTEHETLLRGYMTAFMKWHLEGDTLQREFFTGELRIPAASAEVHCQYQSPDRRTVDHFETETAVTKSSIGGQVTPANLDGNPQEDPMGTLDSHSPHQTRGVRLKWNATTATYESEIPLTGSNRDVSGYEFLSFRVSQTVGTVNLANLSQDFYVTLTDATASANDRAILVGRFDTIPYPYKPEYRTPWDTNEEPNTKSALKTNRIPLHAWTIVCAGAKVVDLSNVKSIKFEFRASGHLKGEILVDDIEFSN
jgi:dienelactone hydrolase